MAVTYLHTADLEISTLTRFPGNARKGNTERIRESIRRHGQYRSLVVRDTGDALVILAGNHTRDALNAEGKTVARCEIIECSDEEAVRINLADNRLAELGDYDTEALVELIGYLDGDLEGTGYTPDELAGLLPKETPVELGEPDDAPPAPDEPVTHIGDLWLLGPHRLLCGDATELYDAQAVLAQGVADVMWTDPPYGVEYVGKTKDALTIQNDGSAALPNLLANAFQTATEVLKAGAPVYVAHADTARLTVETAALGAGWRVRGNLIWVKHTFALGRSDYHWRHEPILYAFTPGGSGRLGRGGDNWYGDNAQDTVFEIPKPARSAEHPTMKPVELITGMLANSCPPGGTVYEPFAGSGSTIIAAHQLGLTTCAIELDPRYVDVICRRYQQLTGTTPKRVSPDGTEVPVDFL